MTDKQIINLIKLHNINSAEDLSEVTMVLVVIDKNTFTNKYGYDKRITYFRLGNRFRKGTDHDPLNCFKNSYSGIYEILAEQYVIAAQFSTMSLA